jgi:N-acetyl-gamma-glutamyl-phosphate reductase
MSGKRVAIVGATGYAGQELTALLERHPSAEVAARFSSSTKSAEKSRRPAIPFAFDKAIESGAETIFLATPNETSAELAPKFVEAGLDVIDLSGAFRLRQADDYPAWYGFAHPNPELLASAVYGLTEWCNGELRNARLVANPGCYPTAILLALKPVQFLISREAPIICDAKSGVSGAGKRSEVAYSFAELSGNFKAYGVGTHRHEPELRQGLDLGDRASLTFVPHLLPTVRGLLATIHVSFDAPMTNERLTEIYERCYAAKPFVRVLEAGTLPELRNVVGTPDAEIGFQLLAGGRRAVIVSVIDNLLKGAASQAVQNFNRMYGFAEEEGLA